MATRDCLGKIRWVRRLPVHTPLSLETVKDYQLLTFSKSGPPRSQPTLSFFNSLQAHTGLALPWFLCKNWFPAHLLLQRLSNWLPDKRHAVFFFFSFYWYNSQAPDWLQGNDSYQRIVGWAAALLMNPHRWDWHLSGGISSCIHLPRCKADLWLLSRCWK